MHSQTTSQSDRPRQERQQRHPLCHWVLQSNGRNRSKCAAGIEVDPGGISLISLVWPIQVMFAVRMGESPFGEYFLLFLALQANPSKTPCRTGRAPRSLGSLRVAQRVSLRSEFSFSMATLRIPGLMLCTCCNNLQVSPPPESIRLLLYDSYG